MCVSECVNCGSCSNNQQPVSDTGQSTQWKVTAAKRSGYNNYLTAVLNLFIAFFPPSLNKEALEFSRVFVQDRLLKAAPALHAVVSILCLCSLPVMLSGASAQPVSSYIVQMHPQIHKVGGIPSSSLDAVGLTQSESASLDESLKTV